MWKGNKAARKRRQRNRQRGKGGGGAHLREAHSRANLRIATPQPLLEMVEVCFLAMGKPTQVDYAVSIIRNIEAHAANDVRYHMLVDKPPAPLEAQMRARAVWRGLPMERIRLQSVVDMSESAKTLYKALSATATGPGGLYLYKPLLHLVLPRSVPRVIVLDNDCVVLRNIDHLSWMPGGTPAAACRPRRKFELCSFNFGVHVLSPSHAEASRLLGSYFQRKTPNNGGEQEVWANFHWRIYELPLGYNAHRGLEMDSAAWHKVHVLHMISGYAVNRLPDWLRRRVEAWDR